MALDMALDQSGSEMTSSWDPYELRADALEGFQVSKPYDVSGSQSLSPV